MSFVWAHAEFIKLMVSRRLVHPVDRPCAIWWLYQGRRPTARYAFWWPHAPIRESHAGTRLAIAPPRPALVHWGHGGWRNAVDEPARDSGLGFHVAALLSWGPHRLHLAMARERRLAWPRLSSRGQYRPMRHSG